MMVLTILGVILGTLLYVGAVAYTSIKNDGNWSKKPILLSVFGVLMVVALGYGWVIMVAVFAVISIQYYKRKKHA